jgi:DNA-binding NtrC family response regulator/tetratricopeptide (TPR) repeat protein
MQPLVELIGESPGIVAVRKQVERLLARRPGRGRLPPILIQGETGTGKGLLARAIHRAGSRSGGPFVDVNCAAIPETLLEAELFGYERGAFTDARHAKAGLFQAASHGTLFLDEVGLLPEALQPKLLKAIEDGAVRRLGSTRSEPTDAWLLTASNEDLARAARERRFREDLYHRLAVVTVRLPTLRERGPRDVVLLAEHFLGRACAEYGLRPKALLPDARAALAAYSWPGNVRELANVMERVALTSDGATVTAEMLGLPEARSEAARGPADPAAPEAPPTLGDALGQVERAHLLGALEQTGWNVTRTAARLGISRDTLRYRMAKHGLERGGTPPRRAARRGAPAAGPAPGAAGSPPAREPPRAAAAAGAADAPAPLSVRWERRRLTFLRCALAVPADGDPRLYPSRAVEVLVDKVQTFGGRVEEMSPTGIVAAFGLEPVEDAPQRAALAAMAIRHAAERAGDGAVALGTRSAIAVRRVLVGASRTGAQIDLDGKSAAWATLEALLATAEPGAILVEPAAAAFLERHFELAPASPGAPAGARRLVRSARAGRGSARRLPAFVGRSRELDLLRSRLEDALRGHGQVVGILGESGIGKSRLLHEFREQVLADRRVTYLEGRCQSYASAIPYFPILDILRANFQIAEADSADAIAEKVRAGLEEGGLDPAESAPYLLRLFGIQDGTTALDTLSPAAVKVRTFEVLRQLILKGAQGRPIVFVVEDLQWIDSTSEECFVSLMDSAAGVPAMAVVTYRPGYRAPWMERSYVTQVALQPLSREDSRAVVRAAARAAAEVPDAVVDAILDKAEGNPFFLEELSRVVEAPDGGPAVVVPDTIQEVLLARIDRLDEAPRRLLQTAAAIGPDVPLPLLRAVWADDFDEHLRELVRLEFLYAKGGGIEPVYAFTHALTREVAYESVPPARRRTLHGGIARALETVYADRLAEVDDRLAHHYGRTDKAERAIHYLTRVADRAARGHAHTEVVRVLDEALGHAERLPAGEQDRRRLELAIAQAYSLVPLGAFQELVNRLLRHQGVLEALDDPRLGGSYHLLLGRSYLFLGDDRQATRHLGLGLAEAMRCGDDATRGKIHYVLAQRGAMSGHAREGLEHGERALRLLEGAGETWWIGPAHWAIGLNRVLLGEVEAALAAQTAAAARGAEVGDPQVASSAAWAAGLVHVVRGDLDAGIRSCEDAVAISPDPLNTAMALGWLGFAHLEQDDVARAVLRLEQALGLLRRFAFPQPQAWFSAFLADAHRRGHRFGTALELALQALELARRTSSRHGIGWAERALGLVAEARGSLDDAWDHLRSALEAFEGMEAGFEIARTHAALAELARARGDGPAVEAHLEEARRRFRALGLPRWTARVEALAAELGQLL